MPTDEYPVHVWYKDTKGKIVDYVRKKDLAAVDYFLMRELRNRAHRSEITAKTATYFGPEGLLGVAVDTRF